MDLDKKLRQFLGRIYSYYNEINNVGSGYTAYEESTPLLNSLREW
jgi:hypothetical protein